jgi:hypothetical protein
VDYGLFVENGRGLNEKVPGISGFELFSNRKCCGLGPWFVDQRRASPWWADQHGRPWSSPELDLAAALGHGG